VLTFSVHRRDEMVMRVDLHFAFEGVCLELNDNFRSTSVRKIGRKDQRMVAW
jgi:hypothetical protein